MAYILAYVNFTKTSHLKKKKKETFLNETNNIFIVGYTTLFLL